MVKTKREAQRIGRLGLNKPKTFKDLDAAKEQRRLAGIASGKARREKLARIASDIRALQNRV